MHYSEKRKYPRLQVNITVIYEVSQPLAVKILVGNKEIEAKALDISENGMRLIKEIVEVFQKYPDIKTEIIAASIRHPQHCVEAAQAGAPIATIPYQVLLQMIKHPLTDIGISRFQEDWRKVMGETKIV